ncbi:right-handed parallel beta-helix repeat-containing protein [Candidatus Woesearchaeota archaeon]|nr:right-handed parallel beta-helix repeat-containing protein [Candidatus Woesearchaeota archaeon]
MGLVNRQHLKYIFFGALSLLVVGMLMFSLRPGKNVGGKAAEFGYGESQPVCSVNERNEVYCPPPPASASASTARSAPAQQIEITFNYTSSHKEKVALLIDSDVYTLVQPDITTYLSDIKSRFPVEFILLNTEVYRTKTPEEIRTIIQELYGTQGINGLLLVGAVPYAQYESCYFQGEGWSQKSVAPLFYEDMDMQFSDTNGDGTYDNFTPGSNQGPELWSSWIYPNLPSSELTNPQAVADKLRFFFGKTHRFYNGSMQVDDKMFSYNYFDNPTPDPNGNDFWIANTYTLQPLRKSGYSVYNVDFYGREQNGFDERNYNLKTSYENLSNPPLLGTYPQQLWGLSQYADLIDNSSFRFGVIHTHGAPYGHGVEGPQAATLQKGPVFLVSKACMTGRFSDDPATSIALNYIFGQSNTLALMADNYISNWQIDEGYFFDGLVNGYHLGQARYKRAHEVTETWDHPADCPDPSGTVPRMQNPGMDAMLVGDPFIAFDQQDTDGDGMYTSVDNCPYDSNPGQEDVDGNGIGDVCDASISLGDISCTASSCVTPFPGMTLTKNTVLCPGTYLMNDLSRTFITMGADDITLACNQTKIISPYICEFTGKSGDCPKQKTGIAITHKQNVSIVGCTLESFDTAIWIQDSNASTIAENIFKNNGRLVYEPGLYAGGLFYWFSALNSFGGAVLIADSQGSSVHHNSFVNNQNGINLYLSGSEGQGSLSNNIVSNTLNQTHQWGIRFYNVDHSNITNNFIQDICYPNQCHPGDPKDTAGIFLSHDSDDNIISFNHVYNTHGASGIFLKGDSWDPIIDGNDYNLLEDNTIINGSIGNAFEATFGVGNVFRNNIAQGYDYGFWPTYSTDYIIEGNIIKDNNMGIELLHMQNTTVRGNYIETKKPNGKAVEFAHENFRNFPLSSPKPDVLFEGNTVEGRSSDDRGLLSFPIMYPFAETQAPPVSVVFKNNRISGTSTEPLMVILKNGTSLTFEGESSLTNDPGLIISSMSSFAAPSVWWGSADEGYIQSKVFGAEGAIVSVGSPLISAPGPLQNPIGPRPYADTYTSDIETSLQSIQGYDDDGNGTADQCEQCINATDPACIALGNSCASPELCYDDIDNNCDGVVDEGCGGGSPMIMKAPPPPLCFNEEVCGNGVDDDCNGQIDEQCEPSLNGTTCSYQEICENLVDDNCDGQIDEHQYSVDFWVNGLFGSSQESQNNSWKDAPGFIVEIQKIYPANNTEGLNNRAEFCVYNQSPCIVHDVLSEYEKKSYLVNGTNYSVSFFNAGKDCIDCVDEDGDGSLPFWCPGGTDCDDSQGNISPTAPEICTDFRDNNCNGQIDEGCYANVSSVCGTTISSSHILQEDVFCPYGDAFNVNGNNLVFDCNGHTIRGNGRWYSAMGVRDVQNITIKNCTIFGFFTAVNMRNINQANILSNTISSNYQAIESEVSSNLWIASNTFSNNSESGPALFDIVNASLINNVISGSDVGAVIRGDSISFAFNTLYRNQRYGLAVMGNRHSVFNNNITTTEGTGILMGYKEEYVSNGSVSQNIVCGNGLDVNGTPIETSGWNNTCDSSYGWADSGFTSCTFSCNATNYSIQACNGSSSSSEVCGNGLDDNCDGQIDEGCGGGGGSPVFMKGGGSPLLLKGGRSGGCTTDTDGDGYINIFCTGGNDCDDAKASVHPNATELCDGIDNNCDGFVDRGAVPPACPLNAGVCAGAVPRCLSTFGWAKCTYGAHYEQTETACDGKDNDCDGQVDEGCLSPGGPATNDSAGNISAEPRTIFIEKQFADPSLRRMLYIVSGILGFLLLSSLAVLAVVEKRYKKLQQQSPKQEPLAENKQEAIASPKDPLTEYVTACKQAGLNSEDIALRLHDAGWPSEKIRDAFSKQGISWNAAPQQVTSPTPPSQTLQVPQQNKPAPLSEDTAALHELEELSGEKKGL